MKTAEEFRKLTALLDETIDPKSIVKSSEFAALANVNAIESDESSDSDGDTFVPAPHMLALPAPPPQDVWDARRIASAVLTGVFSADQVSIAETRTKVVCGRELSIHLDNCSHSSGKQRIFCSCKHPRHNACHKYSILEAFDSTEQAFAWMAAWLEKSIIDPAINKVQHLAHKPTPEDIARFM